MDDASLFNKLRYFGATGHRAIFLDHLSIVVSEYAAEGNERERIDTVMTKLAKLAKELKLLYSWWSTFVKKIPDEALNKAQSRVSTIYEEVEALSNCLGMSSPYPETSNISTPIAKCYEDLRCLSADLRDEQDRRGSSSSMKTRDAWLKSPNLPTILKRESFK
jgi:hypothetical protein